MLFLFRLFLLKPLGLQNLQIANIWSEPEETLGNRVFIRLSDPSLFEVFSYKFLRRHNVRIFHTSYCFFRQILHCSKCSFRPFSHLRDLQDFDRNWPIFGWVGAFTTTCFLKTSCLSSGFSGFSGSLQNLRTFDRKLQGWFLSQVGSLTGLRLDFSKHICTKTTSFKACRNSTTCFWNIEVNIL